MRQPERQEKGHRAEQSEAARVSQRNQWFREVRDYKVQHAFPGPYIACSFPTLPHHALPAANTEDPYMDVEL